MTLSEFKSRLTSLNFVAALVVLLNATSLFGQTSDSDSVDFNAAPMVESKIDDATIEVSTKVGTRRFPASYALGHEFNKKGGSYAFIYPTIVFQERDSDEPLIEGKCAPDAKEEIAKLLADPLLRVVHKVDYNQKKDEVKATLKVQFFPEKFKDCALDHLRKNYAAQEIIAGSSKEERLPGAQKYSSTRLTFSSKGYDPRLELRLNTGIEESGDGSLLAYEPDLLAFRSLSQSHNYNDAEEIAVSFYRFDDGFSERRSSFESFKLFCKNIKDVRARFVYYYKAKSSGGAEANATIDFSKVEEAVKELEVQSQDQGGAAPIVDRKTKGELATKIQGALNQSILIDSNGDPSAAQFAREFFQSQGVLANSLVSSMVFQEIRYDDGEYDEVLQKYLEPIIRTKLENAIDTNKSLTQDQKSVMKGNLKDLNITREHEQEGMFKFSIGPWAFGGGVRDLLGLDAELKENVVREDSHTEAEENASSNQTVTNEIEMDCKDFSLYKVNVGQIRANLKLSQSFIATRNGLALGTTVDVPLDLTTEALEESKFQNNFEFYKTNYDVLVRIYEAIFHKPYEPL